MKLRYYLFIGLFSLIILNCLYKKDLIDLKTAITYGVVEVGIATLVYYLTERSKSEQRKYDADLKQKDKEAELIKNHTLEITEMIQKWRNCLPVKIPPTEQTKNLNSFDGFNISYIKNIEELNYFKDIFYHCSDLKIVWEKFVSLSYTYNLEKKALFDLIKKEVNQQLINQNFDLEYEIVDGFYVSIFREIIIESYNNKSGYRYFKNEWHVGNIIQHEVYFCEPFKLKNGKPNQSSRNDETCHLLARTSKPKEIEDIHKELIKEYTKKYIQTTKYLVGIENKLRKDNDNLKDNLKNICEHPSLILKMDCEFIKGR